MKGDRQKETGGPGGGERDIQTLQALAEPNRKRIVELLRAGPRTVGEIAEGLHMRQPQTSKHLKVLLESGLVKVTADANRRIYSLRVEPFRALDEWFGTFTKAMEQRYDKLGEYLKQVSAHERE